MNRWRQLEDAVFYAALQVEDPERRMLFLDKACAGNVDLRAAVDDLLSANADAERFFARGASVLRISEREVRPVVSLSEIALTHRLELPADGQVGHHIGHYRLLQKLGEGGGGVVYMAEQKEPVRRRVALKIIKLGMDTRQVIARFEAERQALALMDHPNIARVLDAGATETGRPYFVMELVRGVKITDFCDQNRLDTRQRLDLFIQICHAIQHAHQKGIIHRDIKPSNVLVTPQDGVPVPKVIDFGIAKAIESPLTDKTLFTAFEQFIGTPAYVSPEQAQFSALDVDTRTDIYSLGVLLYELLTGRTPFDGRKLVQSGLDELRKTLREKEPQRPSVMLTTLHGQDLRVAALHRHAEPPKLVSLLRGDLDWIVMKALEKDRTHRYETANGLALDIQRYARNEPVVARPPSRLYLFQKLVRRNKAVFAASAAVTVALILGLGASTWLFVREREARQEQARLREQAEIREKIAQAAMLVGQDRFLEADALARQVPLVPASLEAAAAFRALGAWHASNGRWSEAAERFTTLLQLNRIASSGPVAGDFLSAGLSLIQLSDRDGYERLRDRAIARVASSTDPVAAERVLRLSLLLPAAPSVLESSAPLGDIAASSFSGAVPAGPGEPALAVWRCASLALLEYRRGHYIQAADWSRRGLAYSGQKGAGIAASQVLLAMACHQLHQDEEARAQLAEGGEAIDSRFQTGLNPGISPDGSWSDWLPARIVLREARDLLEATQAGSPPLSHAGPDRSPARSGWIRGSLLPGGESP